MPLESPQRAVTCSKNTHCTQKAFFSTNTAQVIKLMEEGSMERLKEEWMRAKKGCSVDPVSLEGKTDQKKVKCLVL